MVGRGQVGCVTRDTAILHLLIAGQDNGLSQNTVSVSSKGRITCHSQLLGGCTIIGVIYTINGGLGQRSASLVPRTHRKSQVQCCTLGIPAPGGQFRPVRDPVKRRWMAPQEPYWGLPLASTCTYTHNVHKNPPQPVPWGSLL